MRISCLFGLHFLLKWIAEADSSRFFHQKKLLSRLGKQPLYCHRAIRLYKPFDLAAPDSVIYLRKHSLHQCR